MFTLLTRCLTFLMTLAVPPVISLNGNLFLKCSKFLYAAGKNPEINCISYAKNSIFTWSFNSTNGSISQVLDSKKQYSFVIPFWVSVYKTPFTTNGLLTCKSCVTDFCFEESCKIYVKDPEKLRIIPSTEMVTIGGKLELVCDTSNHNCNAVAIWKYSNGSDLILSDRLKIEAKRTWLKYQLKLTIDPVEELDQNNYTCSAHCKNDENSENETVNYTLNLFDPVSPYFVRTNLDGTERIYSIESTESIVLNCYVDGTPRPKVSWWKDNVEINLTNQTETNECGYRFLDENQELHIRDLILECSGKYQCIAENRWNKTGSSVQKISITKPLSSRWFIVIIILIVVFVTGFLFVMMYFCMKGRRVALVLQQAELMEAGSLHSRERDLDSLNPNLTLDEQIEFSPYDARWEFPKEKLKVGKQLGAGTFGIVMKAEAEGICQTESVTTVAVKMVKHAAEPVHIRTLTNELKILVHLGRHLNVVNLLGAVTKNILIQELQVIVEYCPFGNLRNYLMRHRSEFVNEISSAEEDIVRDESSNTIPENSSDLDDVTVPNNDSVQPTVDSNCCGDLENRNMKPICTQDLMSWSYQVASGMEYLCQRKVLHGDLAARNILLAENKVVKICDFGLSKTMYKYDQYKKKSDTPLPFKWMAIESIEDGIFSTQSDVWSFGIVLWEFFTLAQTPYPGMNTSTQYAKLIEGYRMEKPKFSTQEMYDIMLQCWERDPSCRPSFSVLVEDISNFLDVDVKEHFVNLNSPYVDMNRQRLAEGQSDYLQILPAPDYGALSSSIRNPTDLLIPAIVDVEVHELK